MLSSEYTDTRLLRSREAQLQRDVERIRVARERRAELLSEHGGAAPKAGKNIIARAFGALFTRSSRELQPVCR
jgi:hypothetical protein